jgi:hypothetical protein
MTMFAAYFDDSATPGRNPVVLTMACYMASNAQWGAFRSRWNTLLESEELPHLHMADLTFRNNGRRIGHYKNWDDNREKAFQERVHTIIHETREIGMAMSVDLTLYRKIVPTELNQLIGGPYGFCVFNCLLKLDDYAKQNNWTEPIVPFFESKSGYGHEITTLQKQIRNETTLVTYFKSFPPRRWRFTDKKNDPQLQTADVLAYESNHFWHSMLFSQGSRPTKKSLLNLLQHGDKDWGTYFGEAKLHHFVRTSRE